MSAVVSSKILGAISALVQVYLITVSLGFERMDLIHWGILWLCLAVAYTAIYFV